MQPAASNSVRRHSVRQTPLSHRQRRLPAASREHRLQKRRPRRTAAARNSARVSGRRSRQARGLPRERSRRRTVAPDTSRPEWHAAATQRGRGVGRCEAPRHRAAARRSLHDEGLLPRQGALERQGYFRCNSPWAVEAQRGAYGRVVSIGSDPPRTAAWGYCDRDYPREAIVSPYGFETAQEHYERTRRDARPRRPDAIHVRDRARRAQRALHLAARPELVRRAVLQPDEHDSVAADRGVPDAHGAGDVPRRRHERTAMAGAVLLARGLHAPLALSRRHQPTAPRARDAGDRADHGRGRRQCPHERSRRPHLQYERRDPTPRRRRAALVRRDRGFWDDDALITWTSNIQGWKAHGNPEFSSKLQTIEIYTPNRDGAGKVIGLNHEGIFYDPDALAEPVRMVRNLQRLSGLEVGDPFTFIECLPQIYPVDGRATPASPATSSNTRCPTCMAGRGGRSGRSITSVGWRSPRATTSSASTENAAEQPCEPSGDHGGFRLRQECRREARGYTSRLRLRRRR